MRVPSPTSRSGNRVYLSLWDLFWALVSPILALALRDSSILIRPDWGAVLFYWALSSGFALLAFFALRLQDGMTRYFSVHEALDIAEAVLFAELMTCGALFTLTRLDGIPRSMPLIHGVVLAGGLIAARIVVRIALADEGDTSRDYQCRRERIIVIGANPFAAAFIQLLKVYAPQREPVIAVLDSDPTMNGRALAGVQVLGAPHELETIVSEFAVHGINTDRVIIAGEADFLSSQVQHEIERFCQKRQIELSFLPRMIGVTEWQKTSAPVSANALARPAFIPSWFFRLKRVIDVVASLALLVLLLPILVVAGVLVLLDVGSPVLFWQERVGWRGRSFLIYKFRTLKAPFDSEGNPTLKDRQPSAIGRFLRSTRIDELPQLLNVLLGDMSLIGPRPLLPEDQPENASVRLSVRPGISGWAQVNGAKLVSKEDKEKLDEWYIHNASPWLDTKIAWMTVQFMLNRRLTAHEARADSEQVQRKGSGLVQANGIGLAQAIGGSAQAKENR